MKSQNLIMVDVHPLSAESLLKWQLVILLLMWLLTTTQPHVLHLLKQKYVKC